MTNQVIELDFFKALGLEGLTDDQKLGYLAKIQHLVVTEIVLKEAPKYLAKGDLAYLNSLTGQGQKIEEYLQLKIPEFDQLVKQYTLSLKAQLLTQSQEK